MDEEEELEMIDILSFKSNELVELLGKNNMSESGRQDEILKYLEKQSQSPHFPPVEDFKPGKNFYFHTIESLISQYQIIYAILE